MIRMRCIIGFLVCISTVICSTASAGDGYYVKVSVDARQFMPKNFRTVLTKYDKHLIKGSLLKNPRGTNWNNTLAINKNKAAEIVEKEAIFIIQAIRSRKHFAEVTYHFGVISHYITDAGMPLRFSDMQPFRSVETQFDQLMDYQLKNFRIMFNGYDFIADSKNAFRNKSLTMMDEKISFEKKLMEQFVRSGTVVNYRAFDTRSIPFGIASIVYSRTVNNVVDCWYSIWKAAGGDFHQKPFE